MIVQLSSGRSPRRPQFLAALSSIVGRPVCQLIKYSTHQFDVRSAINHDDSRVPWTPETIGRHVLGQRRLELIYDSRTHAMIVAAVKRTATKMPNDRIKASRQRISDTTNSGNFIGGQELFECS